MRTLSRFLSFGLCSLAVALAGINDGIGGEKIGLGKNPPGKIVALGVTDSTGTVRFRITEPGTYFIELYNPIGTASVPEGTKAMTVKLQGQASKAVTKSGVGELKLPTADPVRSLASGQIVMSADPQRTRLEHPGITFNESGRSHVETIEVTEATDLMLRLTDATPDPAQPSLQGLPEYLNFVAIEGGPSPLSRDMSAIASVRGITAEWIPNNGAALRVTSASTATSTVYSVIPTTQSLTAGFYTGNIDFKAADGTKLDETVPVYIRILPRESRLPPIAERHTYWAPGGNAVINVLNPNPVSETVRLENPNPRDGWTAQLPPAITLGPGQAMEMRVTMSRTALTARSEDPKEFRLVSSNGASTPVYLLMQVRQVTAGEAATCRATKLFPMFAQVFQSGANELGGNIVVEVRDDCNRVRSDATGKVTDESTAQGKAVRTEGIGVPPSKAVTKSGGGQLLEVRVPPTDSEPAIEGKVGSLAISGLELPALAEDDQPVVLEEIVNATSGEPSALAPGQTARIRLTPIRMLQIFFGDKPAENIKLTKDGLLFDIPMDIEPQGKAVRVEGVPVPNNPKPKPQALAISIAPSSPAVETQADGSVVLLKHANLDDPGDDYTATGNAPATAGDIVSVSVTGIGLASLGDMQILVNGTPAQALVVFCFPGPGIYPDCPNAALGAQRGSKLFFTMPEVPSGDDSTEGAATIQVMALGVTSNIGVTSTIEFTPFPGYFRVITSPPGRTVQVDGSNFTYTPNPPLSFPPTNWFGVPSSGTVSIDVNPDMQPDVLSPYVRWDFANWSVGGAKQQTVSVKKGDVLGATFQEMIKITVTDGIIAGKAADDFYKTGSSLTITPTCPSGQVFDVWEAEAFSKLTGKSLGKTNTANLPAAYNIPMALVAKCKAGTTTPTTVQVTLNTNLGPFAAQVQGVPVLEVRQTGPGGSVSAGWPAVIQPVNPGAIQMSVNPAQILNTAGNLRFDFVNWTGNGVTSPGTQATNQPATVPNAATTYTANFDLLNKVEGTVTGTCTVSPAIGSFVKNGSNVTFNVTPPTALVSATYSPGPGATNLTLTNGTTFQFLGGTITVNCGGGPSINVTVITNPPNVQAEVGIANAKTAGIHQASLPASSAQTLTAQDPFLNSDGNYYRFANWTPSGPGVTLPATGNIIYTANYTLAGYQVDASGCGITVGPASRQISANPLIFGVGGNLFVNATPPTGQTFQNFTVSPLVGGGATNTYNTNPVNIPFNGPIKIVATCGAPSNIDITLVSNPASGPSQLGITHGSIGVAGAAGPRVLSIPSGSSTPLILSADGQFVAAGTGYRFSNFTPGGFSTNPTTVTPKPTASTTYTANYTAACYVLTLDPTPATGGTATINPASGNVAGFPANCYAPGTNVTLTTQPNTGYTHNSFGGPDIVNTGASTTTFAMNGPKNVKIFFDTVNNVTLTVATVPPGLDARIGTTGAFAPAPINQSVPANTAQTVAVNSPALQSGTGYRLQNWSNGATTASTQAQVAAANLTMTATFAVACHVLTFNPNPASGGTVAASAAGLVSGFTGTCYAPGTTVTLTANPASGQALSGWTGATPGSGNTATVVMSQPRTVTANFGTPTSIPITLVSDPAAGTLLAISYTPTSGAQSNSGLGAGPRTLNIPGNGTGTLTIQANPYFVTANTGYSLTNFTPGNLTGNTVNITPPPTAATTYTANFALACYMLAVNAAPASGGTVSVSPAASVTGFTNCYAPGTTVTLTANPATGQTLTGWTGATPGSGNTATVVMSQPRTVTANFGAPANVTLTIATVPAGLDARIGTTGSFAPAPVSASVQANSSVPVAVTDPIVRNGTGYRFINWTPGGPLPGNSAGGASASVGASNLTVTANFTAICYMLTTNVAPTGGGTVSVSPATNVVGFGSNCYQPGTVVTLTATPATGRVFANWSGGASGNNASVQVTMSGPQTVTANFGQPPVLNPRTTSRSNGATTTNTSLQIGNSGGAAVNLRITALTVLSPSNVVWDQTAICTTCNNNLPIVIGALPNGGDHGRNIGFRATSGSIAVPISYRLTLQADNMPATQFTVAVP